MGARSMENGALHKDVFVEMNAMWASAGTAYGSTTYPFSTILDPDVTTVTDPIGHNHLPTPEVIKMVGDALKNAPTRIWLHVDVGVMSTYKTPGTAYNSAVADEYLITTGARGGEVIKEEECDPLLQATDPTQPNSIGCHFPDFPGTVGWKFGFQHYRDQAVDGTDGHELTSTQQAQCYQSGTYTGTSGTVSCRRRFDPIRNGLFHYFLYAHALGIPKANPCLETQIIEGEIVKIVKPYPVLGTPSCAPLENNPDFHVPKSFSGVGDSPGGDA